MDQKQVPPDALDLIDEIYRTLYGHGSWSDFLEQSRRLLPNAQAVLFFHDVNRSKGAISFASGVDAEMARKYNAGFAAFNPWMSHAAVRPVGVVMQADQMLPRQAFHKTQYYREFLGPQDIETGLGVTLRREGPINSLFSIICADTPHSQMENAQRTIQAVVPHLNRALETYLNQAPALPGNGPERVAGIVKIGPELKVLSADDLALRLIAEVPGLSIGLREKFKTTDPTLMCCIESVLAGWPDRSQYLKVHHLFLRRSDGALPLRVAVYRPGAAGRPTFDACECIVQLEDPANGFPDAVARFCQLHGLSTAERSVVLGVAEGCSLAEVAIARNTSPDTVRTQLRSIFWKTGLGRQVDLVRHIAVMAGAGSED